MSRIDFRDPKDVWANEVRVYMNFVFKISEASIICCICINISLNVFDHRIFFFSSCHIVKSQLLVLVLIEDIHVWWVRHCVLHTSAGIGACNIRENISFEKKTTHTKKTSDFGPAAAPPPPPPLPPFQRTTYPPHYIRPVLWLVLKTGCMCC